MNILFYVYDMKKTPMKKFSLLLAAGACFFINAYTQKPPLDHSVYDGWKNINSPAISADGKWVTYEINPQQGDGWLYLYNAATGSLDSVARGIKPVIAPESKYLVSHISPAYGETRAAKKKKFKDDQMPKNDMQIRLLPEGEVRNIPGVKSFSLPENKSFWMAYLLEKKPDEKKDTISVADTLKLSLIKEKKKKNGKPVEPKGTELVILNPLLDKEFRFNDITEYVVAKDGKSISFLQDKPDTTKIDSVRVFMFDTDRVSTSLIFEARGTVKKLTTDKPGNQISFIYTSDTSKTRVFELWISKGASKAFKAIDTLNRALPLNWSVSENANLSFSYDGTRLYFGTAPHPVKEAEDTLLDEEKYRLDIWSWTDDVLQPVQKKQLDEERKLSFQAVYHVDRSVMFQMADTLVPVFRTFQKGNSDFALASSNLKYRKSLSWDSNDYTDYYIINVETGSRKLVLENTPSQVYLSPAGNYLLIYDIVQRAWFSMPVTGGEKKNLTASVQFPLYDELNDVPDYPRQYGMAGFLDVSRHVIV